METERQPSAAGAEDTAFVASLRRALARALTASTVAVATPPGQLLQRLVGTAMTAIPSPAGSLLLIDQAAGELTFEVALGQAAAGLGGVTVPLGRGIAGLVAVSGQPLAIANAQQDPRHARDIAERAGYLPNTILAVPVTAADGAVVGVLELLDRQGIPTFSLGDMDLLGQFAGLCALALEQRRADALYADIIGRALVTLGGLPADAQTALAGRLRQIAQQVATDPVARRARYLADQVATIADRGEAEQRACEQILAVFAAYIAAHPEPGAEVTAYFPGGTLPGRPQ